MTRTRTRTNTSTEKDQDGPAELPELLRELEACGHHGARLLERSRLPLWSQGLLFQLMGFVAKADGRVTELDIRYGEALMRSLDAPLRRRRRLIRRFSAGKQDDQPQVPAWFRLLSQRWPGTALRMGMALGHMCHQDGPPSSTRTKRCQACMVAMGLSATTGSQILHSYRSKVWITNPNVGDAEPLTGLAKACQILGGTPSDSMETLRRAYRRQRSTYHPDRVQHSDIDPQVARARLEELHKAWDLISRRHPEA